MARIDTNGIRLCSVTPMSRPDAVRLSGAYTRWQTRELDLVQLAIQAGTDGAPEAILASIMADTFKACARDGAMPLSIGYDIVCGYGKANDWGNNQHELLTTVLKAAGLRQSNRDIVADI